MFLKCHCMRPVPQAAGGKRGPILRSQMPISFLLAVSVCLSAACGAEKSQGAEEQSASNPLPAAPSVLIDTDARAVAQAALPQEPALLSFASDGRLRARDARGGSFLLSRSAAPVAEWVYTDEEKKQLGSPANLFRASADFAWRFEKGQVTTYVRNAQGWGAKGNSKLWKTEEDAWRPLGFDGRDAIVFVEGKVRVVLWNAQKLDSREVAWKEANPPRCAGFFSANWIYFCGAESVYSLNKETGDYFVSAIEDAAKALSGASLLAFRLTDEARATRTLSKATSFAAWRPAAGGAKASLTAGDFVEPPRK